jgi:hypothetical protein
MRVAWKMEAKAGMARSRNLAEWLEECFTVNRLGVPPSLQGCTATTNVIESTHA